MIEAQAERIAALEAKCALLAASLDQEEKRSEALEAGLTDGVTDDMAMLQSRVEELEAQLKASLESGEPIYQTGWQIPVNGWGDVSKETHDSYLSYGYSRRRIVYAHPPAAAASEELLRDCRAQEV
jgi:hypothetical protein